MRANASFPWSRRTDVTVSPSLGTRGGSSLIGSALVHLLERVGNAIDRWLAVPGTYQHHADRESIADPARDRHRRMPGDVEGAGVRAGLKSRCQALAKVGVGPWQQRGLVRDGRHQQCV